MHSCYILGLAKLVQTHWVFKIVYQLPAETVITEDLNTFSGLPVTCHLLCTADNFLMSVAMFYVATLAIYLFCRPPHPDYPEHLKKVNRIKTMNNSLFIEKLNSKPTVITFTFISLHMSSEHYCFACLYLMNLLNFIELKEPVYLLFH